MRGGNDKSGVSWQARGPLDEVVGQTGHSTSGPSLGRWGPDNSFSWLRRLCKEERPWAGPECQAGASPFTEGHPEGRGWLWGACGALHATQPRYLTSTGSWSSLSESGRFLLELGRRAGPQGWTPACSPAPHLLMGPGQVKPLSFRSIYTQPPAAGGWGSVAGKRLVKGCGLGLGVWRLASPWSYLLWGVTASLIEYTCAAISACDCTFIQRTVQTVHCPVGSWPGTASSSSLPSQDQPVGLTLFVP